MDRNEALDLYLSITISDSTEEDLDRATRQLLAQLKEFDVESVRLAGAETAAPAGTKTADPIMLGAIALAVLPTTLPKIIEFLQAWCLQGRGRTFKFKGKISGQPIDFEGSLADLQKLSEILEKQ